MEGKIPQSKRGTIINQQKGRCQRQLVILFPSKNVLLLTCYICLLHNVLKVSECGVLYNHLKLKCKIAPSMANEPEFIFDHIL